jgi:hypothetical protein
VKEVAFIEKYLSMDSEGDYVVKTKPCPFLDTDNTEPRFVIPFITVPVPVPFCSIHINEINVFTYIKYKTTLDIYILN